MERRFSSIVVAVDLDQHAGDPTTLAARLGAAAGVPIELVAEVPTTSTATGARAELGRRIAAARLDRSPSYVLSTPAPGSALAEHVAGRAGVLLVTAATTWTSLGPYLLDASAEQLLSRAPAPVLVLGPNFAPLRSHETTVVAVVDGSDVADAALPVVEAWVRTFPCAATKVVEVLPAASIPPCDADRCVRRYVRRLAERGVVASGQVLRGDQPAPMLAACAAEIDGAVLVVTSPRWAGEPSHWFSTVRRIIHVSTQPVLVVPDDLEW